MLKQRSYKIALVVSLLLHVIILLSYAPLAKVLALVPVSRIDSQQENVEPQPITFDLVQDQPRELVETPEEARTQEPPERADFLSDKNARAQDENPSPELEKGLPYSDGETKYKIFAGGGQPPMPQGEQPNPPAPQDQPQEEQKTENETKEQDIDPNHGDASILRERKPFTSQQRFNRDLLAGVQPNQRTRPGTDFSDDANWDNRNSSADALGGVSLNTYAWDFAPYILYMKRRMRDHIYPPPAFMQMGAISGEVVVRFKVHKDGSISDLEMVEYKGHSALVETSLNAVRASSPFRPLPESFPEKYLELTWTFIYSIL